MFLRYTHTRAHVRAHAASPILMPVTHSMITRAHDLTSIYGPRWLRWLSFIMPFDKAVVFHKACAKYFILRHFSGLGRSLILCTCCILK